MSNEPLPYSLRYEPFSTTAGKAAGLTQKQLRHKRLLAPRYGVRVSADAGKDVLQDLREYAARMPKDAVFCGMTAARIYGLPLPFERRKPNVADVSPAPTIHVAVPHRRSQPVAANVSGRRLSSVMLPGEWFEELPVLSPAATFVTCCRDLSVTDAIVMLEAMLTDKEIYPGLRLLYRPIVTVEELEAKLAGFGRLAGIRVAREALTRARQHVASPMESRLRLLLVDAGLPEPEINVALRSDDGTWLAEVDLLYRDARMVIEYEGDGHRTNAKTFQRDIERERRIEAAGYLYVRVTITAMRGGGGKLVTDLRRQLAARARAQP